MSQGHAFLAKHESRDKRLCGNEYAQSQQKGFMMSHDIPVRPWQTVSMDVIFVDHYSDFWEIDHLPDLSTWSSHAAKPSLRGMDCRTV